jgi:hypothetical protein
MNRFDLHLHSKYSPDALPKPESIARQARKIGLKGFAITDHNSTKAFAEFKKLQKQDKNLLVIFGEEVKILENEKTVGELLCYFLQEGIKPASFAEIIDSVRTQAALVSIAHPFDLARHGFEKELEKELKKVDAIEVFNARAHSKEANKKALRLAERKNFPFTAGSDSHSLEELGIAGIEYSAESIEELRKAILKRKCKAFGEKTTPALRQWEISVLARVGGKEE